MRLWVRKPGNQTIKRRSLLSQAGTPTNSTAATAAAAVAPKKSTQTVPDSTYEISGRRLLQQQSPARRLNQNVSDTVAAPTIPLLLFSDPYLQAAAAAAAVAETAAAEAAYAAGPEPEKADALGADSAEAEAQEAAALNPLQLEPMLLAAARYRSMALASEIAAGEYDPALLEQFVAPGNSSGSGSGSGSGDDSGDGGKAPALAVPGSLDYYLYGDNKLVDSGQDYSACRAAGRCWFVCWLLLPPLQHAACVPPARDGCCSACLPFLKKGQLIGASALPRCRRVPQQRPHSVCVQVRMPAGVANSGKAPVAWSTWPYFQPPSYHPHTHPSTPPPLRRRVSAVGNGWIELERALPYDMRVKWEVCVLLGTAHHRLCILADSCACPAATAALAAWLLPSHPSVHQPRPSSAFCSPACRSPCFTSLCPACSTAAWRASPWSLSGVSCCASWAPEGHRLGARSAQA